MFRSSMLFVLSICLSCSLLAQDWPRFRGPDGAANAGDANVPVEWSPKANLGWKTEMPGPGASSPIVVGDKAFLTCYSGYGITQEDPGEIEDLVRHLVCVSLETGEKLWQKDVPVQMPEDTYTGIGVTAHGYASHTPVSDGTHVYTFYGKSGVHAYDMDGNKVWEAQVGKESDPRRWGSSCSPILHEDLLIVVAACESQSVIGFNKLTGEEVWRQEASGLDNMWGTPTMVKVDDERTDLVMCVAREMWGMNPNNGELVWYSEATAATQAYSSVIPNGKRVYAFMGGRSGGGSVAIDVGGTGDVSETNKVWTGRDSASYSSPVRHDDRIFLVTRNILYTVDAETGERLDQQRLKGTEQTGGRFGSLDYPSPVVANDHLYYMNGSGQMFVYSLGEDIEQVALNKVTTDKEIFWGSPAISGDKMLLRSSNYLYCVANKGETVDAADNLMAKADEGGEAEEEATPRQRPQRRTPADMFKQFDSDSDGKITAAELEGNQFAERLMSLDKDEDGAVSEEEFTTGLPTLQQRQRGGGGARGGGGGGARGGNRGGGGGARGGGGQDSRPERPQRPKSAGQ